MSTTTSGLGLKKYEITDKWHVTDQNGNLDKIDACITDSYKVIPAGGTGTAITLACPSVTAYEQNRKYSFIASANNGAAATTVKINDLAAKQLYKAGTTTAPTLIAGKVYDIWDGGTAFFFKAAAEGDATAADVLAGKKFSNDSDTGLVGTYSNLKSNQRGVTTIPYNVSYVDIPISTVDTTKVLIKSRDVSSWSYGTAFNSFQAYLVNSTTLRLERNNAQSTAGYAVTVAWSVTEFNEVKSRQEINTTNAGTTHDSAMGCKYKDITITSVDMSKCMIEITTKTTETAGNNVGTYQSIINAAQLTSNTNLRVFFASDTSSYTEYLRIQILEFK